jgi:fructose-1,6-bisphosphatase/inositol monophosphatase family enzyme
MSDLLPLVRRVHERMRERIVDACARSELEELASIAAEEEGDTIYAVDRISESALLTLFEELDEPIVLVAEGLGSDGHRVLPAGRREEEARWRVLVDPIDGTRGLMYQKRSAWILTGVARNRGAETSLRDVVLAVQTEIPLLKQHLSDVVWATRGEGAQAERHDRLTGERRALALRPSRARSIAHGFASVSRFFPGARDELASIDEEIVEGALGPVKAGKAHCFEDQYISTGGQLYELMSGRDRFVCDLRPLMEPILAKRGTPLGICCHPYDLATELIAREAGVVVTDPSGRALEAPLDVATDVAWVGYANDHIRRQMEPLLQKALARRGLL